MTVVSSETRLVTTAGQLPRVNLLPPEISEKARARNIQIALGAGLLAAVGVVGMLYVSAGHSVSDAQSSLNAANAQGVQLTSQTAKLSNVTALYSEADAAQAQLTTAMGQEVRYSLLLNDLSLSDPSTVWLQNLTYTQTPPASTAPAATGTAGAVTTSPTAPIGTVSVTGVGFQQDDLALWLDSIAGLKAYSDPTFTSATESLLGKRKIVTFNATANMTPASLSGRYTQTGS